MHHGVTALVGLTGGIAAGKSTISSTLSELGVPIIDADILAREVVEPGSPALDAIAAHFGASFLNSEGQLDRPALGRLVFSDHKALMALNAITHPAILNRAKSSLRDIEDAGHRWCVYEAALILENNLSLPLALLIGVICDPEVQVTRLMARNGLDEAEARRRLAAQVDNATRKARCDEIIHNRGDLQSLRREVINLKERLDQRFGGS